MIGRDCLMVFALPISLNTLPKAETTPIIATAAIAGLPQSVSDKR